MFAITLVSLVVTVEADSGSYTGKYFVVGIIVRNECQPRLKITGRAKQKSL